MLWGGAVGALTLVPLCSLPLVSIASHFFDLPVWRGLLSMGRVAAWPASGLCSLFPPCSYPTSTNCLFALMINKVSVLLVLEQPLPYRSDSSLSYTHLRWVVKSFWWCFALSWLLIELFLSSASAGRILHTITTHWLHKETPEASQTSPNAVLHFHLETIKFVFSVYARKTFYIMSATCILRPHP